MRATEYLRAGEWPQLFGYMLFISVLAAGYYYNLTFVQLGLIDLGTRLVDLSRFQVSIWMAVLALVAFATAIAAGTVMIVAAGVPTSRRSSGSSGVSSSSSYSSRWSRRHSPPKWDSLRGW